MFEDLDIIGMEFPSTYNDIVSVQKKTSLRTVGMGDFLSKMQTEWTVIGGRIKI